MAEEHVPSADIIARRSYTGSTAALRQTVALSTTTAKNATALTVGVLYTVKSDVAWFFNHGPQASVTATTSNYLIAAFQDVDVWVRDTNSNGIAGILSSGTGTLYIQALS